MPLTEPTALPSGPVPFRGPVPFGGSQDARGPVPLRGPVLVNGPVPPDTFSIAIMSSSILFIISAFFIFSTTFFFGFRSAFLSIHTDQEGKYYKKRDPAC